MRSTKLVSAPAVAAATALLLAACGQSDTTSGSPATPPATGASSPAAAGHGGGAAASSTAAHGGAPSSAPASSGATAPSTASSPAAASAHDAQDVAFAREMIPHHASAIAMAKLARQQAGSAEVKALAGRIEQAQDPEIQTMSGWLRSWNEPVPDTADTADTADPMGHGGMAHGMAGMDPEEMRRLRSARGAKFDQMFLQMMIRHHQDAVDMAEQEQARGQFPPAKELARSIAQSQTAEIKEMRQLLERR